MSDWSTPELVIETDPTGFKYTKPPVTGVLMTALSAAVSIFFITNNSSVGYLVCVVGSLVGGFTAFIDQKRRADPNYSASGWFRPALTSVRLLVLAVALLHIARLAEHAANGGKIIG